MSAKPPTRPFPAIVEDELKSLIIPKAKITARNKKDAKKADLMSVVLNYQMQDQFYEELQSVKEAKAIILQAVRQLVEENMPEKIDIEVPPGFPIDPLMVADQAYNSALDEYRSNLLEGLK